MYIYLSLTYNIVHHMRITIYTAIYSYYTKTRGVSRVTLLKRINYLLDVLNYLDDTRAFIHLVNVRVRVRGYWCANARTMHISQMLEYNYIYTRAHSSVNLYLFSRVVSQILFIRHRSHFLPGTAIRGLRRLLRAAITHSLLRGPWPSLTLIEGTSER